MGKDARVYEQLAVIARELGYRDVSGSAIHDWRKRGLLPAVIVRRLGFGARETEIPAELLERLREVCRLRYDERVRDLRVLGAILWLDGVEMPISAVVRGLDAELDAIERFVKRHAPRGPIAASEELTDREDADVDAAAVKMASAAARSEAPGEEVALPDLEIGLGELIKTLVGRLAPDDADADALDPVARWLGLGRAHDEGLPGAPPWLPDAPGAALQSAIRMMNVPYLRGVLSAATPKDLERARALVVRLHRVAPAVSSTLSLGYGRGAFGLGFLASIGRGEARLMPVFPVLLQPDDAELVVGAMEVQADQVRGLVDLGFRYLDEHPEVRTEVEKSGLVRALEKRDALRPE